MGDNVYGNTGVNLKVLRLKNRLTQKEVAAATGLSHRTISNLENNKNFPQRGNLAKLAKLYGVTVEEITEANRKVEAPLE
ncbi:helix-turn-helix transcriptional regulator [Cytobacillus firmus]|uniref:helix-turn-helix transcriptional regulator n=1 Tax=Cytobacillus firmus TaxID=1399 RepID=UPI0019D65700|nr:helix-turn-helix transcriptional regulator [Cytobacillus firmus]MED1942396.1 helix-turn-helix transcriptional regulator [Cytobacillus firmus]